MNITVLSLEDSPGASGWRRGRRVASLLADAHDVEQLTLFGTTDSGQTQQAALIQRTKAGDVPTRAHRLPTDVIASATATISTALPGQHALAEAELRLRLRTLRSDLLILTEPELAGFCRQLLNTSIPLAVIVDQPSAVTSELAVADALIVPGPAAASTVAEILADNPPAIHIVAPHVWQAIADSGAAKQPLIAAIGSEGSHGRLESLAATFLGIFPQHPRWALSLTYAGAGIGSLTAQGELAGIHGAVTINTRADAEDTVLPAAAVVVLAGPDTGDTMTTMLTAIARGSRALTCWADPDVADLVAKTPGAQLSESPTAQELDQLVAADQGGQPDTARLLDGLRQDATAAMGAAITAMTTANRPTASDLTDRGLRSYRHFEFERPDPGLDPGPATPVGPLEGQLLARQPELVRWSGTLNEEHSSLLEPEVLARNLKIAAAALRSAGVDFIVVSGPYEPGRIAIEASDARDAVAAIRTHGDDAPVYTERIDRGGRRRHRTLATETVYSELDAAIVAYVPIVAPSRTLRYGPAHGCSIEFWSASDSPKGFNSPLGPTRRGKMLTQLNADAVLSVASSELPTTRELTALGLDEVDFPIDAVWTWVDDTDPAWRARRDAATGNSVVAVNGDDASRFNNRDELRYSLRSAAMYAPWIRHHYIVTDGQRPSWLADHPRVTVIDHGEIFSDPGALPTFNSHSIESQLHHIDGLAETFLYFNDDVFLGRRVRPELFFSSTEQSKSFASPTTIPPAPPNAEDLAFYSARKNNRNLIDDAFGRTMIHGYLHTPHALRVSVLAEMEQRFGAEWARTQHSRFRSPDDIAIASSLHHAYAQLTGRGIEGSMRSRYVKAGVASYQWLMRQILAKRNLDAFCLNDTADRDLARQIQADAMRVMLESYFPMAAPWEHN